MMFCTIKGVIMGENIKNERNRHFFTIMVKDRDVIFTNLFGTSLHVFKNIGITVAITSFLFIYFYSNRRIYLSFHNF